MSRARVGAAIALAITVAGCADHLHIQAAASPNPFVRKPYFALLPLDEGSLRVANRAEAGYVASLDRDRRTIYALDKKQLADAFRASLVGRAAKLGIRVTPSVDPGSNPFVIRPALRTLEPGSFGGGWASASSRTVIAVRITTPDGGLLDEITLDAETGADTLRPTSGIRWVADATELGGATADYLRQRVFAE